MLYLIKSAKLIEDSKNILENDIYESVFKVGYAKEVDSRYSTYRTENVSCKLVRTREGEREEEYILHLILRNLGLNIDKGKEWYKLDQKVLEIFDMPFDDLKKMLWENRGDYFSKSIFINTHRGKEREFRSIGHKIFYELYNEFVSEDDKKYFGIEIFIDDLNKPVKNENFKEIDGQYRDLIFRRMLRTGEETGSVDNIYSKEEFIVSDFLDNHFYKTRIFDKKMKIFCEFMDQYKESSYILDALKHRIPDQRFMKYYNYYGTKGCSARKYQERSLFSGLKTNLVIPKLGVLILDRFQVGENYPKTMIKQTLQDIYEEIGITDRTPKATDLGDYFALHPSKVQDSSSGKWVNSFKLGKKDL